MSGSLRLPSSLAEWLAYLETLHPRAIALGLDRVRQVYDRLELRLQAACITVAGTNGKGSTCAMMEAMLHAAGYRVGLYSSPHLLRYNERVRIDGAQASDGALCEAFAAVEAVRAEVPLTYFEFGTLACLWMFARAELDAVVLEVGLGGRLDAVNIVDCDVAVLTTVDIDHVDYLGRTREEIGREKAGIFRAATVAICADREPPASVVAYARELGAKLRVIGVDFGYLDQGSQWQFWARSGGELKRRFGLPHPALRGAHQLGNAAAAIAALDAIGARVPLSANAVRVALVQVELPGRFQVLPGRPAVVLDVAHNPQAGRTLADNLLAMGFFPRTMAVFAMLADKDAAGVIAAMSHRIDRWLVAPLPGARGGPAVVLSEALRAQGVAAEAIAEFASVGAALQSALSEAGEADRIVVFGSFLTVAAALSVRQISPWLDV